MSVELPPDREAYRQMWREKISNLINRKAVAQVVQEPEEQEDE